MISGVFLTVVVEAGSDCPATAALCASTPTDLVRGRPRGFLIGLGGAGDAAAEDAGVVDFEAGAVLFGVRRLSGMSSSSSETEEEEEDDESSDDEDDEESTTPRRDGELPFRDLSPFLAAAAAAAAATFDVVGWNCFRFCFLVAGFFAVPAFCFSADLDAVREELAAVDVAEDGVEPRT